MAGCGPVNRPPAAGAAGREPSIALAAGRTGRRAASSVRIWPRRLGAPGARPRRSDRERHAGSSPGGAEYRRAHGAEGRRGVATAIPPCPVEPGWWGGGRSGSSAKVLGRREAAGEEGTAPSRAGNDKTRPAGGTRAAAGSPAPGPAATRAGPASPGVAPMAWGLRFGGGPAPADERGFTEDAATASPRARASWNRATSARCSSVNPLCVNRRASSSTSARLLAPSSVRAQTITTSSP